MDLIKRKEKKKKNNAKNSDKKKARKNTTRREKKEKRKRKLNRQKKKEQRQARKNKIKGKSGKSKRLKQKSRKTKKKKDMKKSSKKKKNTKTKKRGKKRRKSQKRYPTARQDSSCKNVTCLNTMVQVMKIRKDQVKNFLKQNIRITKKLTLAGNKGNKSSNVNTSLSSLQDSLGGETALSKNRAVCHGKYNITEANEGNELYNKMAKCDSSIKKDCKVSLEADVISELASCQKTMTSFKTKTDACLEDPSDCSCWDDMVDSIKEVKKCNIAKAQEDKIKGNLTICKTTFQACKKYEDSSVAYVSKCKTSSSNLKSILSSLYFAKNKLNAVKSKASTIANTTSTTSRSRRAALNSSTELISAISSFVTKCQSVDVDDIGTDTSITSLKSQDRKSVV